MFLHLKLATKILKILESWDNNLKELGTKDTHQPEQMYQTPLNSNNSELKTHQQSDIH